MLKQLALCILVSLCALSLPSSFVVSATAAAGGDGTLARPFATVNQAARLAKPGDTIYLRGGVQQFADTAGVMSSGTAVSPIIVTSYPGERAIVDGSRFTTQRDAFWISGSWVTVRDLDIRNASGCGISLYLVTGNVVSGCKVSGNGMAGIAIQGKELFANSNITISGNWVYGNVRRNNPTTNSGAWPPAVSVVATTGARITRNRVYENFGEGIGLCRSTLSEISQNSVADNYSVNVYLDNVTQSIVTRNYITGSPSKVAFFRGGQPASGITVANEAYTGLLPNLCDSCTISSNIIRSTGYGITYRTYGLGGGLRNFNILGNSFLRCSGLMFWIQPDAGTIGTTISGNIFRQTSQYSFVNCSSPAGLTFASNCWYGGYAPAVVRGPGDVYQDPLFLNTTSNSGPLDFALQASSPCINKAIGPIAPLDYFGAVKAASGGSMGAVEATR